MSAAQRNVETEINVELVQDWVRFARLLTARWPMPRLSSPGSSPPRIAASRWSSNWLTRTA
jgi:hypothetical protein